MGRRSVDDPKAQRVTLRFSAGEALAVRQAAAAAGMTLSEFARERMLRRTPRGPVRSERETAEEVAGQVTEAPASRRRAAKPRAPVHSLDPALWHELRKQGVNLNQIAHRLNASEVPLAGDLSAQLAETTALIRAALALHRDG